MSYVLLKDLIDLPHLVFFLQYEYFNAVLINEVDEEGNNVELGGEFMLQPNEHFNNLSVNLSLSVVQVPTNMYNKGMFLVISKYNKKDALAAPSCITCMNNKQNRNMYRSMFQYITEF